MQVVNAVLVTKQRPRVDHPLVAGVAHRTIGRRAVDVDQHRGPGGEDQPRRVVAHSTARDLLLRVDDREVRFQTLERECLLRAGRVVLDDLLPLHRSGGRRREVRLEDVELVDRHHAALLVDERVRFDLDDAEGRIRIVLAFRDRDCGRTLEFVAVPVFELRLVDQDGRVAALNGVRPRRFRAGRLVRLLCDCHRREADAGQQREHRCDARLAHTPPRETERQIA